MVNRSDGSRTGTVRGKRLAALALAVSFAHMPARAEAEYRLTILHTNDFHSRVEPISRQESTCGEKDTAANACFGGWARLMTAIKGRRAADGNSILLDAGDQFQGSLFYTFYKGRDTAEFMRAAGYEAMAVGNHEFDDGPAVLAPFVESLPFPVLSANSDMTAEPKLQSLVKPSTIVEKAGEKIGIIGLTPEETGILTIGGRTVAFTDPIAAAKREAERLTGMGVTKIILLSHSGYLVDQAIAAAVPGIDVIVGGHSHTLLSNTDKTAAGPYPTLVNGPDGTPVPIVQAASYGKYLGELTLVFDDAGKVTSATGAPILLDGTIAEDPATKQRVAELAKPLAEMRVKVVASTAAEIDGSHDTCRSAECAMGDLVADAMLERVASQGITIAIANGGGLRASIDAGDVTMGEVLTVLPFQNTLSTFQVTGADIVAALENGVSQVEGGAGRFPQVAGLTFAWSKSGEPGRSRIKAVRVKLNGAFVPIDPGATYGVVTNNFMRGGGDGYAVFAQKGINAYDYGPTLDSVVVDYLAKSGLYRPHTDGRIIALP